MNANKLYIICAVIGIVLLMFSIITAITLYDENKELKSELDDYHVFSFLIGASPYWIIVGENDYVKDINDGIYLLNYKKGGSLILNQTDFHITDPIVLEERVRIYGYDSSIRAMSPMDAMIHLNNYTKVDGLVLYPNNNSTNAMIVAGENVVDVHISECTVFGDESDQLPTNTIVNNNTHPRNGINYITSNNNTLMNTDLWWRTSD